MAAIPFVNLQPSLAITRVTVTDGNFPSRDGSGSASGDTLGFVYDFAGNFAPGTSLALQGPTRLISQFAALFSLVGATYGGDGASSFKLPDLQGTAIVGAGTGTGLTSQTEGVATGEPDVTLTAPNIPDATGTGQAFTNMQPSLPLEYLIATSADFPFRDGSGGGSESATFLGQIAAFEGSGVPDGWSLANGILLQIKQNPLLFSILGTTFGGDGTNNFRLPDLRGRIAVGASTTQPLGTSFGQETNALTLAQLPVSNITGNTGGGQSFTNAQPSLAVNYLIATSGLFPSRDTGPGLDTASPTLGQIVEFGGNFAPIGWAICDGSLLSILSNPDLFAIVGTQYGGDGISTFALPDFRGRTAVGTGTNNGTPWLPGTTAGTSTVALVSANVACFLKGTRIATPDGEIAVEDLIPGGRVVTLLDGQDAPVIWIGQRTVNCARHPEPDRVRPIRVGAGAFGPGQPHRDLYLSPNHAILLEGALIPVKYLIDGGAIAPIRATEAIYYHIELTRHDAILAEGLPVESYLDTGDRANFANSGETVRLFPDFGPPATAARREANACAPIVVTGPVLRAARLRRQASSASRTARASA